MKVGGSVVVRRLGLVTGVVVLAALLAACTGRGGGYIAPGPSAGGAFPNASFTGRAQFGFDFSCEDPGGVNPPTGKLRIQLAYSDKGTSPLLGAPFGIHGIADKIDPVVESAICIGQNPPPGGNELIFLGRYHLKTSPPAGFPTTCPRRETSTSPMCRFEVMVRDNDGDRAPSRGDFFSIQLSNATSLTSQLDPATVFYARAGFLAGGNLTVR